ncbi:unnamed protein product [Merluccius merluccius]
MSFNQQRLQNPKIEKAEILDLAVEYLRTWTDGKSNGGSAKDAPPRVPITRGPDAHPLDPMFSSSSSAVPMETGVVAMETAGIYQCIAHLDGYVQRIAPAESASLLRELRHYMDSRPAADPASERRRRRTRDQDGSSPDRFARTSKERPSSLVYTGLHHDYLSPPPSPLYFGGPPPSAYGGGSSPPPFPAMARHFSFSPSASFSISPRGTPLSPNTSFSISPMATPLSPNTSFSISPSASSSFSISPRVTPLSSPSTSFSGPIFIFPSPTTTTTTRRTPQVSTHRESPPTDGAVWRPWF